ncbi:MAG: phosphoenolpyruvate--protein phosphotransferase [Verrucomicrobiae bacterium]|nr:phosphoenolpyruvate--protein phosphotransferase [Verrucomicrobiae bacterium]
MRSQSPGGEVVLRGVPASPGVCRGRALVLEEDRTAIERRELGEGEVDGEIGRLERALVETRHEVNELQRRLAEAIGTRDASIFEVHLLILEDPVLLNESSRCIREQRLNADAAFSEVARNYAEMLGAVNDPYLRERAADIRDVTQRVLNRLSGRRTHGGVPELAEPAVVISRDLTPSTTAQLDRARVLGFATDVGSRTSHTAILAKSLNIPAVVGLHEASLRIRTGDAVLLDGYTGAVFVNPTDQTLFEYGQLARRRVESEERLQEIRDLPAVTLDGERIVLSGNIELAEDAPAIAEAGAEGVGLFRTEYLFLHGDALPDEEAQLAAYRTVAEAVRPASVIVRTLDIGGDKFIPHLPMPKEVNPFLGWRAIRFCLQQRDLFRTQLRAILRASAHGGVKIMYPMISGVDELLEANALLAECREALRKEGHAFDEDIEVGAMIEIPSAVMVADRLAEHVQFFSIGTNDLIQYTLAIDRLNDRIAHLYEPTHPAVLRLIRMTVEAGRRQGIWVGVCGEMAGDPVLVPLLLGLGVNELSAAPASVPGIKHLIRRCRISEARELAEWALRQPNGAGILSRSEELTHRLAPILFPECQSEFRTPHDPTDR